MKARVKEINFNYSPVNQQQREFHASRAKHKLLMGGFGSGKTYPAIFESYFHALDNPGHNFYVFRNTWDSVEENIMNAFLEVGKSAGIIKKWTKDNHELILPNDCRIYFRPLSLGQRIFKGYNMCGFFIDDPDAQRYRDTISFLFSRLRNTPTTQATRFQTIITANFEGHDWLWQTYMKDREPGGDTNFAYWLCPTTANPTLPDDFITDLEAIHSKEWIDRYVHCKLNSFTGLIYGGFDKKIHHLSYNALPNDDIICRILAIDVGIAHPSVILQLATDGKRIYVYGEFYAKGMTSGQLGNKLVEMVEKDFYHALIIDPSSNKTEQTSGKSVKKDMEQRFGLRFKPGNNDVSYGIGKCRDLMQPVTGPPRLLIDTNECINVEKEMGTYRFKEPIGTDSDDLRFEEVPDKKKGKDDALDTMRYGVCYLERFLGAYGDQKVQAYRAEQNRIRREDRQTKLRHCKTHPERFERLKLIDTYRKMGMDAKEIRRMLRKNKVAKRGRVVYN